MIIPFMNLFHLSVPKLNDYHLALTENSDAYLEQCFLIFFFVQIIGRLVNSKTSKAYISSLFASLQKKMQNEVQEITLFITC